MQTCQNVISIKDNLNPQSYTEDYLLFCVLLNFTNMLICAGIFIFFYLFLLCTCGKVD